MLREHCEREGRDYDDIEKTVMFTFDVGENGEKVNEVVDRLGALAELGIQTAIGGTRQPWRRDLLELMGSDVIPAVAGL